MYYSVRVCYVRLFVKCRLGMNTHIKMCAYSMCKCDYISLPICWLATSVGFINMTHKLSVFLEVLTVYLVVILEQKHPFSAEWSMKNWPNAQAQRFSLQKCSFNLLIRTEKLESPLPQTHMSWFSETLHKAAKNLLDLQVSIWTFCKGFFSVQVCLPRATRD